MTRHRTRHDPVFVDRTGRRRRAITLVGAGGALTLTVAVVVLAAGFIGAGPGRLPGLPELLHGPAATPSSGEQPSPPPTTPSRRPSGPPSTAQPNPQASAAPTTTRPGNRPSTAQSHPEPTKKKP